MNKHSNQHGVRELPESEPWFRTIFDSVNDAILVHDLETGAILDVNRRMCELYGYTRSEALRLDIGALSSGEPPYTLDCARELMAKAAVGEPQVFQWQARNKAGDLFWVEVSLSRASIGGEERLLTVVRDITDRLQAEQALRRSEEKYRELVQNANSIIIRWNCQGELTFFNEFAQSFFGYSEEEVLGRSVIGTIVPETETSGRDLAALMMDICNNSQPYETNVNENMLKDGTRVWIAWTNRPIFDERRKLVEVLSVGVDVTELRRTTEALRESTQMLQLVFDTVPARVFWKNNDLVFMGCSRLFAMDAGLASPAEIVGKTDFDMPWKNTHARAYRDDDRTIIETGLPKLGYEESQMTAEGRMAWIMTSKAPLRDADGKIIGVLGTYEDITERKLAEIKLRRSEEHFRSLFDNAADALFLGDRSGRFVEVNEAGCNMLGYTRDELLNLTVQDVVVGYCRDTMEDHWQTLLEGGSLTVQGTHQRKDGTLISVESHLTLFDYDDQTLVLAVVRDITERQRAEEERRALEQRVEEQKRQFYRETIFSVTGGRLDICEHGDIAAYLLDSEMVARVCCASEVSDARCRVKKFCQDHGLDGDELDTFMIGVGEAITNAIKHGKEGIIYAGSGDSGLWIGVKDHGPGIDSLILPRAVLLRGYSTKPSLGLGYSVMLDVADQIHLKTDESGTIVILEKRLQKSHIEMCIKDLPDTWDSIPL